MTDCTQIPTRSPFIQPVSNLGSEDEGSQLLPAAFAGQEVEDLAYGACPAEVPIGVIPREVVGRHWGDEEEDEEVSIPRLILSLKTDYLADVHRSPVRL